MIKQTYDELDTLLAAIADEADAAVPYANIKRAVLQRRRDAVRFRRNTAVRTLSAAAVLIILCGACTLFFRQTPLQNMDPSGYNSETGDPRVVNTKAPAATPGGSDNGKNSDPAKNIHPHASAGPDSVKPKDFVRMSRKQLEGVSVLKYTGEFGQVADEGAARTAAAKVVKDIAGHKWMDNTVYVRYNDAAGAWIVSGALVKAAKSDTAVIAIDRQAGSVLMVWLGDPNPYRDQPA